MINKSTELDYQNAEISMLANLIAENAAKEFKEFKDYLNYKTEMDFICHKINTDKFLKHILNNTNFFAEFIKTTDLNLKVLQFIYNNNKKQFHPTNLEYTMGNKNITCSFNSSVGDKKRCRVKVNYMDIIWGLLMWKSKSIYQLIHEEILVAPIY